MFGALPQDPEKLLVEVKAEHGDNLTPLDVDRVKLWNMPSGGLFDFTREILFEYMAYAEIRDFLTDAARAAYDSGEKTWEPLPLVRELVLAQARDYMMFGWGKAMDHRGLSAGRTISKMRVWMRLLGEEEMVKVLEDDDLYAPYGVPMLLRVCKYFDWPVPPGDQHTHGSGTGGTVGRMMDGLPCAADCSGCGGG